MLLKTTFVVFCSFLKLFVVNEVYFVRAIIVYLWLTRILKATALTGLHLSVLFALKYSMFSELGEKRRKWMGKFGLCPGVIDEVYKHSFGAGGWGNLP
mgnify:CR=1 FL=1